MLDTKKLTKEYKFIVIDYSNCQQIGWSDWNTEKLVYRFVNTAPRFSMKSNINRGHEFRVREYFRGSVSVSNKREKPFLKDDEPANEAYLTRALVAKLKSDIAADEKDLRDRRKQLQNYVWAGKGFVDMTLTFQQAIERVERRLKNDRKHLRVWKKKHDELIEAGVYTYLELLR